MFAFVGGDDLAIPFPFIESGDGTRLWAIFTDTDLANRHAAEFGWQGKYPMAKIGDAYTLRLMIEQQSGDQFTMVAIDPWKGVAKWPMTRAELNRNLRKYF